MVLGITESLIMYYFVPNFDKTYFSPGKNRILFDCVCALNAVAVQLTSQSCVEIEGSHWW